MSDAPLVPTSEHDAITQVFKWVVAGNGEADIREGMAKNWPGRDAGEVLGAVMMQLRSAADAEPAVVFGWCVEATRDLYRRMVEIGDFAGALRAVKQMSELVKNVPDQREAEEPRPVDTGTLIEVRSEEEARSRT
jgi:hypothetical protein